MPLKKGWNGWIKELADLKEEQSTLNARWQAEKDSLEQRKQIRDEIDRVEVEIQQAERDYDLNKAAELKYGKLTELQQKAGGCRSQPGRSAIFRSFPDARRGD